MSGKLIDPKGKGSLLNPKPSGGLFNAKPFGNMLRQTEDDVVVHLFRGMPLAYGFLMYVTYPEEIEIFP